MKPIRAFATQLYEAACGIVKAQKLSDPHEDLNLTILYVAQGTRDPKLIVPVADGQLEPPEMLAASLQIASTEWGRPDIIIHSADAHMKVIPTDFDWDAYRRGDLALDPGSKEVLAVTAYCRDDDEHLLVVGRYMPYGYDDDGSIRFDDVIDLEEPPGGAFDEVIRQAFTDTKGHN